MGLPVPAGTEASTSSGCGNIISSNCVLWQGPDIECITICTGDTLSNVVSNLGILICNITDMSNYDMRCLNLSPEPTTLQGLIQEMIDAICALEPGAAPDCECDCEEVDIPEAWQTDTNPTQSWCPSSPVSGPGVTADCTEFPQFMFDIFNCFIGYQETLNTGYNQLKNTTVPDAITTFGSKITTLTTRMTDAENDITALQAAVNLTTTCELGIYKAGDSVALAAFVANLETVMCEYKDKFGTVSEVTDAINKQCTGLAASDSLESPGSAMSTLTDWVAAPDNISDTIKNLWITLCDLREGYKNYLLSPTPQCTLIPVTNLTIDTITSSEVFISFTGHSFTNVEAATSYTINLYAYDTKNLSKTGDPLKTVTATLSGTNSIPNTGLDADLDYYIEVLANYSCGSSAGVSVIGRAISCNVLYKATVHSEIVTTTPLLCDAIAYNEIIRKFRVKLTTPTGSDTNNNTGSTITVYIRLTVADPLLANDVYEDITLTVLNNQQYSDYYQYTAEDKIVTNNPAAGNCEMFYRADQTSRLDVTSVSTCQCTPGAVTFGP